MSEAQKPRDERFIKLGLNIAYYRKLNRLTQAQLAERVKINPKYMSQIERQSPAMSPSLKVLFAMADVFQIPAHKLLDFDN
ncbi:MAG: helix-turn-helix domain-containing protein [Clostridiales bacterium]|nr:helix-turn-helix domain-containing protein [Clostridiales bacterium]